MSLPEDMLKGGKDRRKVLIVNDTFKSISAYGEHVSTKLANDYRANHYPDATNSSANGSLKFCGGLTLGDAVEVAQQGGHWPEGVAEFEKLALELDAKFIGSRTEYRPSVQGSRVSVPRHLANNPRAMMKRTKQPAMKKALTLGVNVGVVSSTSQTQINNRGVAILGAVKELESKGYSVEVWACFSSSDCLYGDETFKHDGKKYKAIESSADVLIKPSGARFNAGDLAFALAHAAFSRRLGFAMTETTMAWRLSNEGYGNGVGCNFDRFDTHLPYVTHDIRSELDTPQDALQYVREALQSQIDVIEKKVA